MRLLARELTAVAVAPRARRASGNRASKFRRASTAAVTSTSTPSSTSEKDFPSFFPPEVRELTEPAAIDMAKRCELVEVAVPGRADAVLTSCVGDAGPEGSKLAPFVLLHGFDSSCLEYRRLFPKLAAKTETWAVDLLGWGFTDARDGGVGDYSPEAKRAHLYAFWKEKIGRPMVLCGASLGGAAAIDFATNHPEAVEKLVLVDAQGFIEGLGPMGALPRPIAKVGVNVLRTTALRNAANQMAYFDKATFATEDALRVGRLHTFAPQWCDATLSFMKSGGFKVRNSIPKVPVDTLVMWGRKDQILEPSYADKFMDELPNARMVWVERCGHVAHLEQPDFMCETLLEFAQE
jgi:pimeloyl-ACP methyl ester carboxylesterase